MSIALYACLSFLNGNVFGGRLNNLSVYYYYYYFIMYISLPPFVILSRSFLLFDVSKKKTIFGTNF